MARFENSAFDAARCRHRAMCGMTLSLLPLALGPYEPQRHKGTKTGPSQSKGDISLCLCTTNAAFLRILRRFLAADCADERSECKPDRAQPSTE